MRRPFAGKFARTRGVARANGDAMIRRPRAMPRHAYPLRHVIVACAALSLAQRASAAAGDDIRSLVESGQGAAAYAACATADTSVASDLDLWCGIAAVDTGRPGEGLLALERYSLTHAEDVRGRLELARAYFYAGDDRRARTEFEAVLRGRPAAGRAYRHPALSRCAGRARGRVQPTRDRLHRGRFRLRQQCKRRRGTGRASACRCSARSRSSTRASQARHVRHDGGALQFNYPVRPAGARSGPCRATATCTATTRQYDLGTGGLAFGGQLPGGAQPRRRDVRALGDPARRSAFAAATASGSNGGDRSPEVAVVSVAPQAARLTYAGDEHRARRRLLALAVGIGRPGSRSGSR